MFVEYLKCQGQEVRTGLDDREIEWKAFTYIWIFGLPPHSDKFKPDLFSALHMDFT